MADARPGNPDHGANPLPVETPPQIIVLLPPADIGLVKPVHAPKRFRRNREIAGAQPGLRLDAHPQAAQPGIQGLLALKGGQPADGLGRCRCFERARPDRRLIQARRGRLVQRQHVAQGEATGLQPGQVRLQPVGMGYRVLVEKGQNAAARPESGVVAAPGRPEIRMRLPDMDQGKGKVGRQADQQGRGLRSGAVIRRQHFEREHRLTDQPQHDAAQRGWRFKGGDDHADRRIPHRTSVRKPRLGGG